MQNTTIRRRKILIGTKSHNELAFLHTATVHEMTFTRLMQKHGPGIQIRHDVDETLLTDAMRMGLTHAIINRTQQALVKTGRSGASVVICTCSTLGSIAELLNDDPTRPTMPNYMRIDRPMADLAVASGHRIQIVAALASTLEPTRKLLEGSAAGLKVSPEIETSLIPNIWEHFQRGDEQTYHSLIARYLETPSNYPNGYPDIIVLAQASMAPAAHLCKLIQVPILSSPTTGVMAAIEMHRKNLLR
jgi:hypothetical protein